MAEARFVKVYYKEFAQVLLQMKTTEMRVLGYLFFLLNNENRVITTYTRIAQAIDCSPDAVGDVMRDLLRIDVVRREAAGVYMVNPKMMARGKSARVIVLADAYRAIPKHSG